MFFYVEMFELAKNREFNGKIQLFYSLLYLCTAIGHKNLVRFCDLLLVCIINKVDEQSLNFKNHSLLNQRSCSWSVTTVPIIINVGGLIANWAICAGKVAKVPIITR